MKCHYCNGRAVKINTRENRTGSGTTTQSECVCKTHASLWRGRYDHPEDAGLIEMGARTGNFRAQKIM
jgi:hypothetical protein